MAEQRFAASFRGVPFFVTEASDTAGHHTVVHEFPGRKPVVDQNGPTPQRFRLDCVLIGANYQSELQALEDALNAPGAGRLMHHWRGSFLCKVEGEFTVTRSTREGGMARISVTFIVADEEDVPSVGIETFDLVITEGDIARARMADAVAEGFDAAGSNTAREASGNILADIAAAVADANGRVQSSFGANGAVASVGAEVAAFGRNIEGLINAPHTMATTISNVIDTVFSAISNVIDTASEIDPLGDANNVLGALRRGRQILVALGIFRDGAAFGSDYSEPAQSTPQQVQRLRNQDLLVQTTRVAYIVAFTATIASVGLDNRRRASQVFDAVSDAIDELRADVDDETYRGLSNLRAAFGRHLREQSARLPEAIQYTPVNTVPALLLAHTLYGDATRDAEIVERNADTVLHPGFIRGSVPLEVLSA